ncbi:hypothetical protein JOF56_005293 [Kibdelosporangium banguiense]|uniref:Uncharacterized protein n=1 Tax=Kibdelosporangium banguiense TaxID=1365924 RepID=A0ABS4TLW4_9PSEU|nr:hypothetical protein [Kibdelosporangium banguiense]MBP2324908.1 hypothetical protein [Kibdelosporangium banguiense]
MREATLLFWERSQDRTVAGGAPQDTPPLGPADRPDPGFSTASMARTSEVDRSQTTTAQCRWDMRGRTIPAWCSPWAATTSSGSLIAPGADAAGMQGPASRPAVDAVPAARRRRRDRPAEETMAAMMPICCASRPHAP